MNADRAVRAFSSPRRSVHILHRDETADLARLKVIRDERRDVLAYHRDRYLDVAWAVFDVESGVANSAELLREIELAERRVAG